MLTQEKLKALLHYDPETGVFTRLITVADNAKAGDEAGWIETAGYRMIRICGVTYKTHRLAWLFVHGKFPDSFLDHRDKNRANNQILNLREATPSMNSMYKGKLKNNTSGFKGVYWVEKLKKFKVMCSVKTKQHYLGLFLTAEEASEVYQAFAKKHFGEFYHS